MAYRGANTDRISNLPIEIIEKILNLLPCYDAVRTSILSTDWRYKWMSMSDLNFREIWVTVAAVAAAAGNPWAIEANRTKFINQFLLRHRGPIRKFDVEASLVAWRNIEQWMQLISKHDIEELKVEFSRSQCDHIFPASLFNCKKLTHLELSGCVLDIPTTFEGFPNLKVLKLYKRSRIESLISNSPLKSGIESLISKSPLIESLSLDFSNSSNISLTISAPKLKYLSLQGFFKDISLENSPILVDMNLSWRSGGQSDCDLIKILSAAPNLEKLAAQYCEYKNGCSRGVISTTFNYLKVVTLAGLHLLESGDIPLILELLRNAPNLEKLGIHYIRMDRRSNEVDSSFWKKEYLSGHCFMKLKVIEMGYILCMAPEIEFAKFILSNSPILEEMTIAAHGFNQEKITHVLKLLPKLPRASAQVAVTFLYGRNGKWIPKL